MGLTFVEATVTGKKGKKATVKFLVDSGAISSLLPEKDWKAIGLKPKRSMTFTLADGMMYLRAFTPTTPEADATLHAAFPAPLSTFSWDESVRRGEIYRPYDSNDHPTSRCGIPIVRRDPSARSPGAPSAAITPHGSTCRGSAAPAGDLHGALSVLRTEEVDDAAATGSALECAADTSIPSVSSV